jgi:hypothetical protein
MTTRVLTPFSAVEIPFRRDEFHIGKRVGAIIISIDNYLERPTRSLARSLITSFLTKEDLCRLLREEAVSFFNQFDQFGELGGPVGCALPN